MKKKCSWWKGHCLHQVAGTERKAVRTKKKVCFNEDDYIYERFWGKCIDIVVDGKCCWCDTIKELKLLDFDTTRAMNYPNYEEKK